MSRLTVVNYAAGSWYPQGQDRLRESIRNVTRGDGVNPPVDTSFCRGHFNLPAGCPSHQDAPYAFKVHLVQAAAAEGARYLVWADASTVFLRHPMELVDAAIANGGVACFLAGWTLGEWTCDRALPILGLTREEAFKFPLIVGGVWAVDAESPRGNGFLELLRGFADRGALAGPWDNVQGAASQDPRVKGHRHDQPAMSVALRRAGLNPLPDHRLWSYWDSKWTQDPSLIPPSLVCASRGWGQ